MKYREILDLYKQKKLDEQQAEQVKADIEKQEAIGDYLLEEEARLEQELGAAGEAFFSSGLPEDSGGQQDEELVKKIQAAMRKAFLKVGILAGAAAVMIVIFALVILPRITDLFFYDPGKKIGEETNQMSLDMEVYTELHMPGYWRDLVQVEDRGYGSYDIVIVQSGAIYPSKIVDVAGKIVRNKLSLYDRSRLHYPTVNAFDWNGVYGAKAGDSLRELKKQGANVTGTSDKRGTKEVLKALNKGDYYQAYVTLDRRMSYEEFRKFIDEKGQYSSVWCAVSFNIADENGKMQGGEDFEAGFSFENLGFLCDPGMSCNLEWDRDAYPNLIVYAESEAESDYNELEEKWNSTEYMTSHFISALRYMDKQEKFVDMMGREYGDYNKAATYIEKYGILVCGYSCWTDRATLLELIDDDRVYQIHAEPVV